MSLSKKLLFVIVATTLIWLSGYVVFAIRAKGLQPQSPDQKVDAIVVLTGGQGRIETGLQLLADGNAEHVFITGVHPDVRRSEIRALWKNGRPLPNCCIMLGYEARTTQQNAKETRDWLKKHGHKSIRVVTGNFHMMRALNEFNHEISGVEIIPHAIKQPRFESNHKRFWIMAFYEYHKTIMRWLVLKFENYLPDSIINLQLNPQTPEHTLP